MDRQRTVLPPGLASRRSRQELTFHAPGIIEADRPFDGRLPVFDDSNVWQVWGSCIAPVDVPVVATMIRYPVGSPTTPVAVGTFQMDTGAYVQAFEANYDVQAGDQLSMGLHLDGTVGTPGRGYVFIVRLL